MVEVQILIPAMDNTGAEFSEAVDEAFEDELGRLFGGYSLLPGTVVGGWRDPNTGVVYSDTLRVYGLFVGGLLAAAPDLLRVVEFAKSQYGQLALSVRYLGQAEIL